MQSSELRIIRSATTLQIADWLEFFALRGEAPWPELLEASRRLRATSPVVTNGVGG